MSRKVFMDTSFFVAALDKRDHAHARAIELAAELDSEGALLVSTDAVMLEIGNYFSKSPLRKHAIEWIGAVRQADGWEVMGLNSLLMARGVQRYRSYGDKTWGLVDCASMEAMLEQGIRDVATTDDHFTQAGFRILMGKE